MLCELATSQLEALHMGMDASIGNSHMPPPVQHAKHSSSSSNSEGQSHAHQALSVPYPHTSVNLTHLSMLLSAVVTASGGLQSDRAEKECRDAIKGVRELMIETTTRHAQLFNTALESACRYAACVPTCVVLICITNTISPLVYSTVHVVLCMYSYCALSKHIRRAKGNTGRGTEMLAQ